MSHQCATSTVPIDTNTVTSLSYSTYGRVVLPLRLSRDFVRFQCSLLEVNDAAIGMHFSIQKSLGIVQERVYTGAFEAKEGNMFLALGQIYQPRMLPAWLVYFWQGVYPVSYTHLTLPTKA